MIFSNVQQSECCWSWRLQPSEGLRGEAPGNYREKLTTLKVQCNLHGTIIEF